MKNQQEAHISDTDSGDGTSLPDEPTPTIARDDSGELPAGALAEGMVLAGRYRLGSQLGRGGMGVVWRAFDLKLRVEVALKSLHMHLAGGEKGLAMVRREVRAAREVISPNVCRIFDLIEAEGRELVSMEYVDGGTLLAVLKERGPLGLEEAQDMASQFLAGLEAIHRAGLVHRDVKPENIMITRAGRVVLMDFGLARQEDSGSGTVSGTPAYMAPEQAAGLAVDARADVYSAGVVLAEMVSPGGVRDRSSRESVWEGVRHEPARVPETPWAPVIMKAVAREPEQRYKSAHTLTRALEEVTLRVEGSDNLTPYPGLASFTEDDAEYFFGRETEVEAMWAKLEGPARLLGLIGSSGAGKTSFLRAGVIPSAAPEWSVVRCTPGTSAAASLRRALVPALGGDTEALASLASGDDRAIVSACSRWRGAHGSALLVIDQFEELFTLNPRATQERLAELLCRLPLEADIHVLLSLRDDFLMECNRLDALRPLVADLTLLDPPTGANLRRALVRPATRCGYRFEDDELVDEMLTEVEGERGALPMLAFAAARLWEKRDRDAGLLTRESYHATGGVGGALARHAEATMDRVGADRAPIVREIFRNLVTAEGTRAVHEWDELLSVFEDGERGSAEEILRALVDARLLTSYEVHTEDGKASRHVEVIHESLLARWPRLERWQTQDADGALLRDQLRQAARTWDEHERSDDLLWTGTAFREYRLWREHYPGGLSAAEEAFGVAMTRHATRRRRRRRIAVAATLCVLLAVLAIVGVFWRRSISEARRAEAAELVSMGRVQLEDQPTEAVAFAIASLELADSPEVRRLALEALWKGPTEICLVASSPLSLDFSPDGRWLLTTETRGGPSLAWPADGGPPRIFETQDFEGAKLNGECRLSPAGDTVACNRGWQSPAAVGLWSFPEGRFLRWLDTGGANNQNFRFSADGSRLTISTRFEAEDRVEVLVRSWPLGGGDPQLIATLDMPQQSSGYFYGVDPTETLLAWTEGANLNLRQLKPAAASPTISLQHERALSTALFDEQGRQLATGDGAGRINVWSLDADPPALIRGFETTGFPNPFSIRFDPSGMIIGSAEGFLAFLDSPPNADPLKISSTARASSYSAAFHPDSSWFATGSYAGLVSLWPLSPKHPQVLRGHETYVVGLQFSPDGRWLVSTSEAGTIRLWPLDPTSGEKPGILHRPLGADDIPESQAMAPDGSFLAIGTWTGAVRLLPFDGGPPRELDGLSSRVKALAVEPRSRLVAAGGWISRLETQPVVRIWDLATEESITLNTDDDAAISRLDFTTDGDLWVLSGARLRRWDLEGPQPEIVEEVDLESELFESPYLWDFDPERRRVLLATIGAPWLHDLDTHASLELTSHAEAVSCRLGANGDIVLSTDEPGAVRVSPARGGEAHLLLGHGPCIKTVTASADGRWVASGGCDKTIRLWPMPDLSKPPLHTLPRKELLATLRSLTNVRVAVDPDAPRGFTLDFEPFPGWETVPTW